MAPLRLLMIPPVLLVACAGARAQEAACTVSKAQFEALRTGMTYREAVKLLCCDGEEISRAESRYASTVVYAWGGAKTISIDATMNATFQNDKLVNKMQAGLR